MLKERANFVKDIVKEGKFFFQIPESYDAEAIKIRWKPDSASILIELKEVLAATEVFESNILENNIKQHFESKNIGLGQVMTPFRIVVVGTTSGPSMMKIAELLGKNEIIKRIEIGVEKINF